MKTRMIIALALAATVAAPPSCLLPVPSTTCSRPTTRISGCWARSASSVPGSGVELSIGQIAREEIEYLMSRGLNEQEATSLIIKGFISLEIEGIPPALKDELDWIVEETGKASS